ncbi:MAG: PAS domain S-box-containing protein, partial [Saprospiraceae bacterium]
TKALALYHANEKLRKLNEGLEGEVRIRTEELRHSEEKYRGIIEGMELGLLEVDLSHNIIRAYDWFCDMTGFTPNELEGQSAVKMLTKGELPKVMKSEDKKRERGQAGVYETMIYKKNGTPIWVLISGAPLYNLEGKIIGSVGIHYDITSRKKLEEDLKTSKKIAEDAQEAEKQFLARMSHEIRTPLNAIIGMVHLLYDTQPNPEQKDYLNTLRNSADILLRLISYILDISKIEAGEIVVNEKEFDLIGLLNSMQKTFGLKIEQGVSITLKIDPLIQNMMIGDDLLLNQILLNLMGNALKFTDEGEVGIEVRQLNKTEDECLLEFRISDTGIGIGEEYLELIFENFKQAGQPVKISAAGTGLGLAICKQLVEMQGGSIRVESELGVGTTFIFTLSYADSGNEAIIETTELKLPNFNSRADETVLVVEDNYMNRKYLTTLLRKWNIKYDVAIDGGEGWEMAQEKAYSIILMDISMPVMDGHQTTIKIRNQRNKNKDTPIIALTASAILSQKNKAIEIGMNDFLPKPFQPNQLMVIIEKFLALKPERIVEAKISESIFQFSPELDRDYLEIFYDGDLDYAADMFDTFLEYTITEFPNLRNAITGGETEEIRRTAHKFKPTFAMVGLTSLRDDLAKIEKLATENIDLDSIKRLQASVEKQLNHFIPILETDLRQMELFLKDK